MPIFTLAAFYASKLVESIFFRKEGSICNFSAFCLDYPTIFRGFLGLFGSIIDFNTIFGESQWPSSPTFKSLQFRGTQFFNICFSLFLTVIMTVQNLVWLLYHSHYRRGMYKLMRTHLEYLYIMFPSCQKHNFVDGSLNYQIEALLIVHLGSFSYLDHMYTLITFFSVLSTIW